MWVPRFPTEPNSRAGESMGTSFFVSHHGAVRIVGHTGTQAGFRSFVYWDPATRTAVIAAFNTIDQVDNAGYEAGFLAATAPGTCSIDPEPRITRRKAETADDAMDADRSVRGRGSERGCSQATTARRIGAR